MTIQMHSMAAKLSKFKVGDLAMSSALQLERARAGLNYDKSQLASLADALRLSTGDDGGAGKVSYMRPGYFEPFERVYQSSNKTPPKSSEEIRGFVIKSIAEIEAAVNDHIDDDVVAKLVDFCLDLNREFIRRQPTENRVDRRQRSVPLEAFVR